ncbi:MAG: ParA family protein, partial [Terriglobia bacterium]
MAVAIKFPRYAIWNNKGGVGKTFLSFVIASEYARTHSDARVVLIDMCPQANLSEIALGGNSKGGKQLETMLKKSHRKTIGGYFDLRLSSPFKPTGNESSFVVQLSQFNSHLPKNMLFVVGDPSLELQSQTINQIAILPQPQNAWGLVHRWLIDLVDGIQAQHPSAVFFIDCNPSFSAYTELAVLAANRLIVPCTADGSSARAIDNIGQLVYGVGVPASYVATHFATRANQQNLPVPSIHVVGMNRTTQYDRKASSAFTAMYNDIKSRVMALRKTKPLIFSLPAATSPFFDVPDAHTISVVVSN